MLSIAPLMLEHRIIERMIKVMKNRIDHVDDASRTKPDFVDQAIDFFETYTERCHHGKEEDILFPSLSTRQVPALYKETMQELVDEHRRLRDIISQLAAARDRFFPEGWRCPF